MYFKVREFLNIHDILDENYVIYSEYQQDGRFMVKLFCVNPAVNLQAYLEYGIGTVFFSATLLPVRYYKKLLSIETDDYAIYADSPFPKDSRLLLIGRDVSTRYTQRGPEMYRRIASYIVGAADAKKGNLYGVLSVLSGNGRSALVFFRKSAEKFLLLFSLRL